MKIREWLYGILSCNTGNNGWVRWILQKEIAKYKTPPDVLDVGGRKSPYTSSLNINLTVSDIPQEEGHKKELNLGFTNKVTNALKHRSNVRSFIYDDLTNTKIPENTYDMVVCVEVIEHVPEDGKFAMNLAKVLKPGGTLILTTQNGDFTPCGNNPDHIRHYKKEELAALLSLYFSKVNVYWNVEPGKMYQWGLSPLKLSHPLVTVKSLVGGYINKKRTIKLYPDAPLKSIHLAAVCVK